MEKISGNEEGGNFLLEKVEGGGRWKMEGLLI